MACVSTGTARAASTTCALSKWSTLRRCATWARLRIAPQHYAVFTHRGHNSGIRGTCNAIWNKWLPQSGREVDAPDFERYDERFDPHTGLV